MGNYNFNSVAGFRICALILQAKYVKSSPNSLPSADFNTFLKNETRITIEFILQKPAQFNTKDSIWPLLTLHGNMYGETEIQL